MKKTGINRNECVFPVFLLKKLIVVLFCITGRLEVSAQKVNLKAVNVPFESVFKEIEKQTAYTFTYTKELLKKANVVNIKLKNVPIDKALEQLFLKQPLSYTIYNKMVIVRDKKPI